MRCLLQNGQALRGSWFMGGQAGGPVEVVFCQSTQVANEQTERPARVMKCWAGKRMDDGTPAPVAEANAGCVDLSKR